MRWYGDKLQRGTGCLLGGGSWDKALFSDECDDFSDDEHDCHGRHCRKKSRRLPLTTNSNTSINGSEEQHLRSLSGYAT
jgi:hypothetical protein